MLEDSLDLEGPFFYQSGAGGQHRKPIGSRLKKVFIKLRPVNKNGITYPANQLKLGKPICWFSRVPM